ncbi:Glycosyl transferase, group 1 [Sulfurimonas denitrificans DSM 1251]|uniref:Glycosyl transferase, group 1 n=1 Tax=Sulfurimonas denitrificans (strain ATCC 33889 / DSM 1251) TaxID=326298 RepID=Q30PS8_SULDN|nr:glycosyltransferase family 1 protein [Sulfurimonas denitrificans]ABB45003.1 Glycosyl transferase, group 1 [Sulfurimonas denitrificans DSM 1251]
MRIVIDLQGAQTESRFRGIGRSSLSIAQAIARNRGNNEVLIALNGLFVETIEPIRAAFEGLLAQENIKVWYAPSPVKESVSKNTLRREISELIREQFLSSLNPDVVFITSLFEGYLDDALTSVKKFDDNIKTVILLHDLIPYIYPEIYLLQQAQHTYYHRKIEFLKNADLLLGVSKSSCKEAIEQLQFLPDKTTAISSAVSDMFKPIFFSQEEQKYLKSKYSIKKKIIMYAPGGFDKRKNFENLIAAFSKLSSSIKKDYQLVILSKVDDKNRDYLNTIAKKENIDDLVITGYVSDEDLVALYNIADLFVFPSIHEGFGLPLLEAMSCGTASIGSNTTSMPEVIGLKEAMFDPYSVDSIASKIEEVLENETLNIKLKSHATLQAQKFSWDKSAKVAIKAIENLVNGSPNIKKFKENSTDLYTKIATILKIAKTEEYNSTLLSVAHSLELNMQNNSNPNLFIDISILAKQDFGTGIQRVVRSVISELYKNTPNGYNLNLVYLSHEDNYWAYYRASDYEHNFTQTLLQEKNYPLEPKNGDVFLGLDLSGDVYHAQKYDLFTQWRNRGVKIAFVVYDILPILHPQWWPQGGSLTHTNWLTTITKVSDKLISISNAVSEEVQAWVVAANLKRDRPLQYASFNLGADVKNSMPSSGLTKDTDFVLKEMSKRVTFLTVGTIEPRKGHKQTLAAFEKLWADGVDVNLVIVGKDGWMMDDFILNLKEHNEQNNRLFWLNAISDEYLEQVYINSSCLIAPSEGEGFGLPLIEAAQHSLPIIARDIPVFREVASKYAYYFTNNNEPSTLADATLSWLKLYKQDNHPKSDKMPWLTWRESTKQLLHVLEL